MSIDVPSTVRKARAIAGLSARQTAALAGLSPSTISRVEQGTLDPSISVFDRILAACGLRLDDAFAPNVDLDAVRAARRLLEPDLGLPATAGSESWVRRWRSAGFLSKTTTSDWMSEICFRAGQQARLSARPGARRFSYKDWGAIARSLMRSGQAWALTGGYAASLYTPIASVDWAVFYVDDVDDAAGAASLIEGRSSGRVTLLPFDDVTAAGIQELEDGVRLANFWQIVIDCFAGTDRMPDQAEAMIRERAPAEVGIF